MKSLRRHDISDETLKNVRSIIAKLPIKVKKIRVVSINLRVTVCAIESENNTDFVLKVYPERYRNIIPQKEAYLYDLIRRKTAVPVPYVYEIGECYLLLQKIKGKRLDAIMPKIDERQQEEIMYDAGKDLAEINSIQFPQIGDIFGEKIVDGGRWGDFVRSKLEKHLTNSLKISPDLKTKIVGAFLNSSYLLDEKFTPVLLHNDYTFQNLFVEITQEQLRISGVLDLELALSGHNEYDLSKTEWSMHNAFFPLMKSFYEGYNEIRRIDEKFEKRKIIYQIVFCVNRLYHSQKINDAKSNIHKIESFLRKLEEL